MLLMEFHGSDASVAEQAATVQELAAERGGTAFQWATHARGAHAAVDGAPPRVPVRPADAPRLPRGHHRLLRADLRPGRRGDAGAGRGRGRGPAALHRRPRGRRQLPRRLPDRPGPARGARDRRAAQPPAGAARDRGRRHLHRRARHRPAQAGLPGRRGRRGRGGDDAPDQAGARSAQHHESGQDLRASEPARRGAVRSGAGAAGPPARRARTAPGSAAASCRAPARRAAPSRARWRRP